MVDRNRLHSIDEITDYLLISGYGPVNDQNIAKYGITLVVDATNVPCRGRKNAELLKVAVDDSDYAKLNLHFDLVADAIQKHRKNGGKALVHCAAGVSRSAALCIVYLVKYDRLSLCDAYKAVHAQRPMICPNNGFWRQMIDFERKLRGGQTTVEMLRVGHTKREVPDVYLEEFRKASDAVAVVETRLKEAREQAEQLQKGETEPVEGKS